MKNRMREIALCLLMSGVALAQTSSGVMSGRVADISGNSVPGAQIALVNELTGDSRTGITDPAGDFVFTNVQPGTYTVTVTANGFKQFQKKSLKLTASERLSTGTLVLQIGAVNESVKVQADVTPVQTASDERSGLLNDKQLETLMTRGRDFVSLLRVLPGVVGDEGGQSLGTLGTPTVNGVRSEYNSSTIDGITGNTRGLNTLDTPLNLDAIAEVKVLTANYQAEYGKSAGAVITAVTKSGTRQFHGTGYYYIRNEAFNANNFFNNQKGLPRPQYRYNTIGFNLGGPIYWPGRFNRNKDKLFFFYSQEILPNKRPDGTKDYTVPTALERQGDFSQSGVLIKDPLKSGACTTADRSGCFPNNMIPSDRIDRNMQKLLNIFPLPNFFNTLVSRGQYNFVTNSIADTPVDQQVLRVDYNISDKWRMFFRGQNMSVDNNGLNSPANKTQWGIPVDYKTHNPNVALNTTYIASPTLVNELTVGGALWTEDQGITPANLAQLQRGKLGITTGQLHPQDNPLGVVPGISFGSSIPNAASISFDNRFVMHDLVASISITDGLTKTWNQHTFKFGVDLQGDQYDQFHTGGNFYGTFDYSRSTQNPNETSYPYANALLGDFNTYTEANTRLDYRPRTKTVEWYGQDNWRISKKLTLDYGVRFTWGIPQNLKVGANFVPSLYNPADAPVLYRPGKDAKGNRVAVNPLNGATLPVVFIGAFVPGVGNPGDGTVTTTTPGYPHGLVYGNGVHLAPRIGFAYDPFGDGKTSIRGGFGIYYNARARSGQEGDLVANPPAILTPQQFYGSTATFLDASGVLFSSSIGHAVEPHPQMVSVYNMSFGIQRHIGFGAVVDVAYVGTLGRHLGQNRDIDQLPPGTRFLPQNQDPTTGKPLPDDFLRPYTGFNRIGYQTFDSNSSYHSLQAQITRRFSHGLQFGAVWTWSSAMDYTDDYNGSVGVAFSPRIWNYGKAGYDRTHNVTVNWLWDVPQASKLWNIAPVKAVLDNWQISGIASFISGAPCAIGLDGTKACGTAPSSSFTTVDVTDITGGGDSPHVVLTGSAALPKDQRTVSRYFDTSVVARPAQGTFGNASKYVFRGPGVNNWDISLLKNIPIKEKITFQIRAEAYNVFNHTQFTNINTLPKFDAQGRQVNQQFGQVTAAADPRVMQFAARFTF